MKFITLLSLLTICYTIAKQDVYAQSWDELQRNKSEWIIGQGYGGSAKEADQNALEDIASQIRVKVSSEISLKSGSTQRHLKNRTKETLTDSFESIITTYSQVTLNNCKRLVVSNGPKKYHIIRYIAISDVAKIFTDREEKIKYMLDVAGQAEKELKMDVALKNYYWAQILINTLPSASDMSYYDSDGNRQIVSVWVPGKISGILDKLTFEFGGYTAEDKTLGKLLVSYDGQPVTSVDYTYMDGISWSVLTSAKNGMGVAEFRKDVDIPSLSITVEYQYYNELHQDPEIESILSIMDPVNFNEAYKSNISLELKKDTRKQEDVFGPVSSEPVHSYGYIDGPELPVYENSVRGIIDALNGKNTENVRNMFTREGYEAYSRLLLYGNARILDDSGLEFTKFNNEIYCRSIPMEFAFRTNDRRFVENVVLILDSTGKISGLTFALENRTAEDIRSMEMWKDEHKAILIHFLESYKTAFAMKDINYLSSIFSEDALIITGRVVQKANIENRITLQQQYVEYNRQSKAEYMNNLQRSFNSKEYINLKFSNISIGSWRDGLFGISIKQDYYSSNYGDSGYLYLYVDLRDFKKPIIHVRTWQPEPNPDIDKFTGLYGPANF